MYFSLAFKIVLHYQLIEREQIKFVWMILKINFVCAIVFFFRVQFRRGGNKKFFKIDSRNTNDCRNLGNFKLFYAFPSARWV